MRRPFAWLCIVLTAILVIAGPAGNRKEDSLPYQAAELLRKMSETDGGLTITGTVADGSAVSGGIRYSIDHISIQTKDKSDISLSSNIKILITTENDGLLPGDLVTASGEFGEFVSASNPGEFDVRSYYYAQDTVGMLWSASLLRTERGKFGPAAALYDIRRALRRSYSNILEEKSARTIAAISLGEKSWMESEWKELYQEGGISHILAVSGLHITLIGMCLYRLLRRGGMPFAAAAALSGASVLLYAWMTGFGISARRASVMFLIWLGAQIAGRKYDMLTSAAAAALMLAASDVRSLGQSSFWLSFGAVLSIAVLVPAIRQLCDTKRGGRLRLLSAGLLSGAVIWLGTLPCVLYYFYQCTPWSILVNLAVLPLMSVIMASGLAAAVIGLVYVPLGSFFAAPVYYLLACFDGLCTLEQKLPLPVWVAGRPQMWQIILYYAVLAAAVCITMNYEVIAGRIRSGGRNRRRRGRRSDGRSSGRSGGKSGRKSGGRRRSGGSKVLYLLWILCAVLCVRVIGSHDRSALEIVCLDVGQGDGAIVMLPGGASALIDGGSSSESSLWEYTISQSVKYYGIGRLDYVFLSHADSDHISGIKEYLEEYETGFGGINIHGVTLGSLVLPPAADTGDFDELKLLAQEKGIGVFMMEAGASIQSGWSITCLAPDEETLSGDRNEDSMVLLIQYGTFRMLFTGDIGEETEARLIQKCSEEGIPLKADVLKVPHHGSKYSSSTAFLDQVKAAFAVISCGKDNRYGHPAAETLERLAQAGSSVLQTPESGAVIIRSSGSTYSVKTMD